MQEHRTSPDIDRLLWELEKLRSQAEMAQCDAQWTIAQSRKLQQTHAQLCEEVEAQRHYLRQEINRPRGAKENKE